VTKHKVEVAIYQVWIKDLVGFIAFGPVKAEDLHAIRTVYEVAVYGSNVIIL